MNMRTRRLTALTLVLCLLMTCAAAVPAGSEWFEPELLEMQRTGLLPPGWEDADLREVITRGEVCDVLAWFWRTILHQEPTLPDHPFDDTDDRDVLTCYALGLISGYGDGTFGVSDSLNRQQMFCILYRLCLNLDMDLSSDPLALLDFADRMELAEWAEEQTMALLTLGVVQGSDGWLLPEQTLTREQALAMIWRTWNRAVDVEAWLGIPFDTPYDPEQPEQSEEPEQTPELTSGEESYEDKYIRIFGSLDAPKYQSQAEAETHMVLITVPVWNFNNDHVKVQTSRSFYVHEALADTVTAIFEEIFQGDEHFPIHSVWGYSWRGDGTSEHNWGCAIDINPDENYYVYHGVPTTGSHWTPGEDPYSIPEDGDVVRAFARYGFAWGGNAWSSTQDYMHFSYFGT